MSRQIMPSYRFPIILGILLAILLGSLFVQTLLLLHEPVSGEAVVSDGEGDVLVFIGEMYFRQDGVGADNVLEVSVGDSVEFVNEGSLPHTVTSSALDVDVLLEPGESVVVLVDQPLEEVVVNCRLHARHEAVLSAS